MLLAADQLFLGAKEAKNSKTLPPGIGVTAINLDTRNKDFRGLKGAQKVHELVSAPLETMTSLVYPIEASDGFNALPGGAFNGWLHDPVGSFDVSTGVTSGSIATVIAYKKFRAPFEHFDVSTGLVSGGITTVIAYRKTRMPAENFDVSSDLISASLTTTISYVKHKDNPADEGFNVSTGMVSAVLS